MLNMYISFDNLFSYFRVIHQSYSSPYSFKNTTTLSQKSKSNLPNLSFNHY